VQQGWWTAVERAKEQQHLLLQFAHLPETSRKDATSNKMSCAFNPSTA
jgi:hypothetical protein